MGVHRKAGVALGAAELDAYDRKLLAALQENNLETTERLGQRIGLSPSSVQRRVKRLRDLGFIQKDISVLDPRAVGQRMTCIVEVSLERENLAILDQFKRRALAIPEVQQCYYVTGDSDFVLVITARDVDDYEAITHALFFENDHVRQFRTSVVMSAVKTSLAVPVA